MSNISKNQTDLLAEIEALKSRITELETQQSFVSADDTLPLFLPLIEQVPIGIQIFDTTGLCVDVNDALLQIFGVTRDNLIGHYNIFDDPMAAAIQTDLAAKHALQGETVHLGDIEFDFRYADDRFANAGFPNKYIDVTIFPIYDQYNQVTRIVGLNTDITQRRIIENDLLMSEERYRAIVESQHEMIGRFLPDGTFTYVNQAYTNFFGVSIDVFIGQPWQTFSSEEEISSVDQKLAQLTPDAPKLVFEFLTPNKHGESRWIQWMTHALFNEDDEIIEFQSIGIDITEKKHSEQQEFNKALEQERINILSNFVVQASHEFRTPLSIIHSSAHTMSRLADEDKRRQRFDKINRQIRRITRLLDSMTTMTRISSTAHQKSDSLVNINRILDIMHTRFNENAENTDKTCILELDPQPLKVNINEADFVRAMESICENALQHTLATDEIWIHSHKDENNVIIEIRDTGNGMTEETLAHIFERFYREDKVGKTPGIGLGLPIAKALLRKYDGTIEVSSEINIGTTFTITLPLAQ